MLPGKRLVVIGGGAAGFFCAVTAARLHPGMEVTILEKTGKILSKVRVSGGGRCNVTHACFDIIEMSKNYPRGANFVKKAFHQFFTTDTIQWFEERGVFLKTEEDGRIFPVTDSSQTIIDCLMREVNKYNVQVRMNAEVKHIGVVSKGGQQVFTIHLSNGVNLNSDYVVVACGGYSRPSGFDWLKELGHAVEEPVPSLFTFNMPGNPITKLMGVSLENSRVKIIGTKLEQEGALLITHWGMSGPAILKLSAWGARELKEKKWEFRIAVNWIPQFRMEELQSKFRSLRLEKAGQKLGNKNPFGLPQRLWEYILSVAGVDGDKRWADLPARDQNRLINQLSHYEFEVKGKTTYKEEFVTAGGIRLNEVDANTMMSKKVPNLFFAGEILDVDGITGGFNFQHAWTSGFIAGKSIG